MKIPVFVSSPTALSPKQDKSRKMIFDHLERLGLERRALGQTDYPTEFPLREVYVIAKHCSGGVILGFEQLRVTEGIWKPGTAKESAVTSAKPVSVPTPWNHLEAGILFGLRLPLLIFKEPGVSGGVFDNGVTDVFVHEIPPKGWSAREDAALHAVFLKWRAKVSEHYYA